MADFVKELETARSIALEAAAIARERCKTVTPELKSNQSYVTDLDLELENLIRQRLRQAFPQDAISGEELATENDGRPRRWSIDPIDGTGNLVHDLPLWSISVGLLVEGEPTVGVIAIPPIQELYWAVKGQGAWLDGRQLAPLSKTDSDELHPQHNINVGTKAMRRLHPRSIVGRIRGIGSACVETTFLATGRLKACVFMGEAEHDVAAGAVILGEVGASIATLSNKQTLTPAQFVARTPIAEPTLVAAPRRLNALLDRVKFLDTP